ncbi:TPA: helix-turn-helix domain-containing protein [Citrobacter freundii]|jgi:transcriptional regulator with XRE-family HTH domain|nr:transcriptional regulator [Citrobacter freundii]KAA1142403.1 helix-turn-helix domain-containing protein [Citrobacter portucalensis]THE38486.1 transcriptional regulator [Citrobacter murliniae]TKU32762.1 helix-turn-helix domain-containing protein [Citrobacter sp. wls718]TKU47109.1 helix-turn-helix domain-containing protein [Citrobacter sp. wls714]
MYVFERARNMNFGKRLQKAIHDLGISQSELARRLGVKAQSVNGWCNSNILPRADILDRLQSATGYPLYWFFLEETEADTIPAITSEKKRQPQSAQEQKLLEQFELLPTDDEREKIVKLIELRLQELDDVATAYLKKRKIIPSNE